MTELPALRVHQRIALDKLEEAWGSGRRRAWVVLPPGAGKTRVGLETACLHLGAGDVSHVVVLSPNTAIQGQWLRAAQDQGMSVGGSRDLEGQLSSLTYQSLAVFDADSEVGDDPEQDAGQDAGQDRGAGAVARRGSASLLDRLHPHGRALVERMAAEDGLLLVLDECHHLLEVWGRLLEEVLAQLPRARVLGLTGTPPESLRGDQAELVDELFGEVVFSVSVPAVVREGDLAPFAELAWVTTPTAHEEQWLAEEGIRFTELTTHLTDPAFGSVSFLSWLDLRFVVPVPSVLSWATLVRREPGLTRAVLRLHHAGLLALPSGARLSEEHRRAPAVEDWMLLLQDWLLGQVATSSDPRDRAVLEAVRTALPSVGHVWTRNGVRRGRSGVDRVLARSEAKPIAAVEIVQTELGVLGSRLRMLVLCDHERASATLPTGLHGVLEQQSGSALATLAALLRDPGTAGLGPLMVTGSTVAGERSALEALRDHVATTDPRLAAGLEVQPLEDPALSALTGGWSSRRWVRHVTTFFEQGGTQVLVGTRGLLGEGWDARRITGLIDLTTATTLTAVVQTRGRALRTDPLWPEKVAINWSVVCVSELHPKGGNDWERLVRKHQGFHGVDEDGDVVDGVAHLDSSFSAFAPPPVELLPEINARMRERCGQREEVARRWRVGEPYLDEVVPTLRVRVRDAPDTACPVREVVTLATPEPATLVQAADGVLIRVPPRPAVLTGLAALGLAFGARSRQLNAWAARLLGEAGEPPSVHAVACVVAQALSRTGQVRPGPDDVVVEVHPGGEHRCRLARASTQEAALFTEALDEVLGPLATPRYVIARHAAEVVEEPVGRVWSRHQALQRLRRHRSTGVVWYGVPGALGTNASRAREFAAAWDHWVGGDELLYTGSAEGAGVLAAQHGADPFEVTTVVRRHWT